MRLSVEAGQLTVEGVYLFLCHPGRQRTATLFYPLPEDSLLGEAQMLALDCRPFAGGTDAWEPVPFESTPHRPGARWVVPLDRSDSLVVLARYRQRLHGSYARYILTSTQAWGQPLRHARFELTLPRGARLDASSYPLSRMAAASAEEPHYVFETRDFMPPEDLTITWSR
ncbi:MAG: hypothetical protein GF330_01370 [Candidatus Eisenbacteria bacterium]|nr:hypothetical protein [Candidatus Eisenbacteria bacterium]